MRERALNLLGLMRKAGLIALGEDKTGSAARAGQAKLLLLAADASDNARKRAEGFAAGRDLPLAALPFTKDEISAHTGVGGCSMAAVLDTGLAGALMRDLDALCPGAYDGAVRKLGRMDAEARRRREEAAARERNKRIGKRRNSV